MSAIIRFAFSIGFHVHNDEGVKLDSVADHVQGCHAVLTRTEVIDATVYEAALIAALRDQAIAGAALDVFELEPPAHDNPLFGMDNVLLSLHIAAFTREAKANMSLHAAMGIVEVLHGQAPSWPVNSSAERDVTILVPLGTTEAQNLHNPTGYDHFIAQRLSESVAQRCEALIIPIIPFGNAESYLLRCGHVIHPYHRSET